MSAVDSRLLEIVGILLRRSLTLIEAHELRESHRFIEQREWRLARVMNLLHLARQTRDWAWMGELMIEYEKVMKMY